MNFILKKILAGMNEFYKKYFKKGNSKIEGNITSITYFVDENKIKNYNIEEIKKNINLLRHSFNKGWKISKN